MTTWPGKLCEELPEGAFHKTKRKLLKLELSRNVHTTQEMTCTWGKRKSSTLVLFGLPVCADVGPSRADGRIGDSACNMELSPTLAQTPKFGRSLGRKM